MPETHGTTLDAELDRYTLTSGSHVSPDDGVCVMELVSLLGGEPFTDRPGCVSPYLTSYAIGLNDRTTDARRQDLKRFIPLLPGTRDDGKDETRRLIAADFITRTTLPKWLDKAGMNVEALLLRDLPPITTQTEYDAVRPQIVELRDRLYKIRYGGKTRYQFFKELILAEIAKRSIPAAVAVAVADAVTVAYADAVAVAVADAVADAVAAAVAAAVAVADAVAVAAADADAAADAAADGKWWQHGTEAYWNFRNDLYAKVRAIYEERFTDLMAESWTDALILLERLITCEVPA